MSIAETDSSIFLEVFGLEFFYSTWCGLSIQIIHSRLKLKEKIQWWINYHFIEIDTSFARRLSSQLEEKKISIKIDDLDLVLWWFDWIPQVEKNQSDEKNEIHQLKNSIQHKQLSFKTIKLKRINCFQLILFILKLLFSSLLSFPNKNTMKFIELIISE